MQYVRRLLVLVSLVGCATEQNVGDGGSSAGGAPSTGGEPAGGESAAGAPSVGGASSEGGGGAAAGCQQDCSTIEVPACYEAVCNEDTGVCEIGPMTDDSPCEDGAYCTVDDTCQGGECTAGGPRDCTEGDDDPCLVAECDEDLDACGASSAPNGTVCTATDLCQSNAVCQNGVCLGAPLDCSGTPVTSPDCEAAACDPATGLCAVGPVNDGMACASGDLCEENKTCDTGVCLGTPIPSCTLCTETEQNQTYSTANIDNTCAAWGGQISVIGDIDCFSVEVTVPGSRIYAETVDVGGSGCPATFDSVIRLFNSTGTLLASDDQSGVDSCSLFLPTNVGTNNLATGTYAVCVEDWLNNATTPPYLLLLDVIPPGCGNAIVETPEACDGTALAGQTCISQGFGSGTLACDAACAFDTSGCAAPFCGDAIVNGTEECDGTALGGATCVSEGFAGGTLACNASCAFNTAGCTAAGCGNGILEVGEDCEGSALGCTSCELFTCAPGEVAFDVSATGLPIPIIDLGTIMSTIAVPGTGTVTAVGVQINVTHTWDADADIFLTPPGFAQLELTTDNGSSLDNYTNTVFVANAAAPSVTTGTAPFTGVYQPEGNLAGVVGTAANGNWTLTITDDEAALVGSLNAWRVFGCMQP
jgi:subtilisin-like proprotein convertase family protein